jgi:hypothetical protein
VSHTPARHRESWSEKLYRVLLLAYQDMVEVFRDAHRTARQTRGRVGIAGGARPLPPPLPTVPPTHTPTRRADGRVPTARSPS